MFKSQTSNLYMHKKIYENIHLYLNLIKNSKFSPKYWQTWKKTQDFDWGKQTYIWDDTYVLQ